MSEKKKILVFDDDPDIGIFCKTVLETKGWEVKVFHEAFGAADVVDVEKPDLIILDIMMEQSDSGAVLDHRELPVLEVINKPIEPQELVAKVSRVLGEGWGE